jgi:hypothetical protein
MIAALEMRGTAIRTLPPYILITWFIIRGLNSCIWRIGINGVLGGRGSGGKSTDGIVGLVGCWLMRWYAGVLGCGRGRSKQFQGQ